MSLIGKEGSTRRRRFLVHGANALFASLGAIAVAVVGYILVERYRPFRVDMTRGGNFELSPRTLDILEELEGGVSITYFELPPSEVPEAERINQLTLDLLDRYKAAAGGKITYDIANPLREPLLVEELGADYGTAVFRRGKDTIVVPWKEFSDQSFDEMSPGPAVKFTGEEAFSSALVRLGEGNTTVACFLSGHGEASPDSDQAGGYSEIARTLRGNNLTAREVDLSAAAPEAPDTLAPLKPDPAFAPKDAPETAVGAASPVPEECTLLVIAGPSKGALSDAEIDSIAKYWENGHGVVVLTEPRTKSRSDVLVKRFGLQQLDGVVFDQKRMIKSPVYVVPELERHAVTEILIAAELDIVMPESAALKPAGEPDESLTVTPILSTSPASIVVVDIKDGQPDFASKNNIDGPVTLGFAVEKKIAGDKVARAIVIGDSHFATNAITDAFAGGNPLFAENVLTWAGGSRKKLDIGPKDASVPTIGADLTDRGALWILLSTAVCIPATILFSGVFVFIRRRGR